MKIRDDERPVINSANGQKLRDFNLADRFRHIYEHNLWGGKSSVSGPGSDDIQTEIIRRELSPLLQRLGSRVLLDAPCGDASWISQSDISVDYIGVDIVPELILRLSSELAFGAANRTYLVADITTASLPPADTVLCRDCLVHLGFMNIYSSLRNFQRAGAKWLITTTFTDLEKNVDCEDGDWRPLNFEAAPFDWPCPMEVVNEQCRLADGGWRDKSLGVWRLSDISIPAEDGAL